MSIFKDKQPVGIAQEVWFTEDKMYVRLADGREIGVPLAWFNARMFIYFSRLYEKYRRKILPIALFTYDQVRDEPDAFELDFPFLDVLRFHFYKLELKKLNW